MLKIKGKEEEKEELVELAQGEGDDYVRVNINDNNILNFEANGEIWLWEHGAHKVIGRWKK